MLIAKPSIDLSEVRKNWDGWVEEAGKKFDAALGEGAKGPGTIGGGTAAISAGLQKIADEAKKTANASEKLADRLHLKDVVGAIGPVKDIFEKTATSVFGLSAATAKAGVAIFDMAEKGAQLGAVFGPWGALIGAGVGGALGYFTEKAGQAREVTIALAEATNTATQRQQAFRFELRDLQKVMDSFDTKTLAGAQQSFDVVTSSIQAKKDAIALLEVEYQGILRLGEASRTSGALSTQSLSDEQNNRLNAISESTLAYEKEIEALTNAQEKAAEALKKRSTDQAALDADGIKTLQDMTAKELKAERDKQKARYDAAVENAKGMQLSIAIAGDAAWAIGENSKSIAANSAELAESKAAYDAASGALDGYSKKKKDLTFLEAAAKASAEQGADLKSGAFALSQKQDEEARVLEEGLQKLEDIQTQAASEKQIKLFDIETQWEQQRLDALKKFNDAQANITKEGEDKKAKAIQASNDAINSVIDGGAQIVLSAFGDVAVKGINAFYDSIANGERKSKEERKRARAEWARDIGSKLMVDGESHIVMGLVNEIAGRPGGFAEAAAGAVEVGIGAGLGGVGAIAQRRLGGTADHEGARGLKDSTPSSAPGSGLGGDNAPKDLRPIVINFNSTVPNTERGAQEQADIIRGLLDRGGR